RDGAPTGAGPPGGAGLAARPRSGRDAALARPYHGLRARVDVDLRVDVREVVADRTRRDRELGGDLVVRHALRDAGEHLTLALAEELDAGVVLRPPLDQRQALDEAPAEPGRVGHDLLDRPHQLLLGALLLRHVEEELEPAVAVVEPDSVAGGQHVAQRAVLAAQPDLDALEAGAGGHGGLHELAVGTRGPEAELPRRLADGELRPVAGEAREGPVHVEDPALALGRDEGGDRADLERLLEAKLAAPQLLGALAHLPLQLLVHPLELAVRPLEAQVHPGELLLRGAALDEVG